MRHALHRARRRCAAYAITLVTPTLLFLLVADIAPRVAHGSASLAPPRVWTLDAVLAPQPDDAAFGGIVALGVVAPTGAHGPPGRLECFVSAWHDQDIGRTPPQVHRFVGGGTEWTSAAPVVLPSGDDTCFFGAAIALDGRWLAIGAPHDSHDAFRAGAVHVFESQGSAWVHRFRLVDPDPEVGAEFGSSVAIEDGLLLVGSPRRDSAPSPSGAGTSEVIDQGTVSMFALYGDSWIHHATVKSPSGTVSGRFGHCVAVRGSRVAVGAPNEDSSSGIRCGGVHLFRWDRGRAAFHHVASIVEGAPIDWLGTSVALTDHGLIAGAPRRESTAPSGAVRRGAVLRAALGSDGTPTAMEWITGAVEPEEYVGMSVGAYGNDFVSGAPTASDTAELAGAAYFMSSDPTVASVQRVKHDTPYPGMGLGACVAMCASHAAIARGGDPEQAVEPGTVLIFKRSASVGLGPPLRSIRADTSSR